MAFLIGTAVSHLTFDLACDALGYDVSVEIGLLHFEDVDLNILAGDFLKLELELLYILPP